MNNSLTRKEHIMNKSAYGAFLAYLVTIVMAVLVVMFMIHALFNKMDARTEYYNNQGGVSAPQHNTQNTPAPSYKQTPAANGNCVSYDGDYTNDTCE